MTRTWHSLQQGGFGRRTPYQISDAPPQFTWMQVVLLVTGGDARTAARTCVEVDFERVLRPRHGRRRRHERPVGAVGMRWCLL